MSTSAPAVVQVILDGDGDDPNVMLDSLPSGQQLTLLDAGGHRISQQTLRDLRTGPGRRLGSQNKRSQQIGKLIAAKFGSANMSIANAAFMPIDVLVKVLRAADDDSDRLDELERIEALVARLGANLDAREASRLATRLMKVMARPSISVEAIWKEQNVLKRHLARYQDSELPVAPAGQSRPDVVLNLPGWTDPAHLAETVGQFGLTDEEIVNIGSVAVLDDDAINDESWLDGDDEGEA